MKLLAITGYYKPAYVYGGPVRSEAALYENLARLGVEVTVVTTNANGNDRLDVPLMTPVDVFGVQVIYCPTKSMPGSAFYSPTQIKEAKRIIPHVDIVNLQTFWGYATPILSQYCKKHQIPYYVSLRGQLMDYAMQRTSWIKRVKKQIFLHLVGYRYLKGAATLHCTSALEVAQLKNYSLNALTFQVPNGVDASAYETLPARGQLRTRYKIPADALIMVMIGRLAAVKNPHIAVEALIAAQTLPVSVHLIMVGPDEHNLRQTLQEQALQAGCSDKLHFTGLLQKNALLEVMTDSDLFIMPSELENFGMSAVESMAAGLPILVSKGVPVGQWAEEAGAGRMIPCTVEDFQRETSQLLASPSQLKEMGQRGQALVANKFDTTIVAKQMLAQYQAIVATGRPLNNTVV